MGLVWMDKAHPAATIFGGQKWDKENDMADSALPDFPIHVYHDALVLDEFPFHLSSNKDVFYGRLGRDSATVVVKSWRSMGISEDSKIRFRQTLNRRLREWHFASSHHRNIVSILGVSLHPRLSPLPALILPKYKEGNTVQYLANLQLRGASAREHITRAVSIMNDVVSALHFLHSQNPRIIHGSLRGSNILISLDSRGNPIGQLTDVGMNSLPFSSDLTMRNTQEGVHGVRWMAPELIMGSNSDRDGETLDDEGLEGLTITRSDIYGFGMTLYELLTGHPPYSNRRHMVRVIVDITTGVRPARPAPSISSPTPKPHHAIPSLSSLGVPADAFIPDNIWELVTRCWAHDPHARPDSGVLKAWMEVLDIQRRV